MSFEWRSCSRSAAFWYLCVVRVRPFCMAAEAGWGRALAGTRWQRPQRPARRVYAARVPVGVAVAERARRRRRVYARLLSYGLSLCDCVRFRPAVVRSILLYTCVPFSLV